MLYIAEFLHEKPCVTLKCAKLSKTGTQWRRTHTWTEDNRLQTVADNNWFSYYQYDAGGERTYKLTWEGSTSNRSGDRSIYYTPDEATLYASPYLVITPQGYTKHYYAEAERITSQLGKGQFADVGTPVVSDSLVQVKLQAVTGNVEYPSNLTVPGSGVFAYLDTLTNQQNTTSTLYFYHPDHLGSSSWVTDTGGTVVQHLHYLPWGENFVDQRLNSFEGVRYTFSAKERDSETGLSYFGSRYYSSDLSIWLSVDPMSDKYASLSPYVYCADNPVKLVDPNGEEIGWVVKADGTIDWDKNAHNQKTTKKGETYLGEEGQRSVGTTVLNYHNDGTISEQKTVLIMDWGEDPATYVSTSRTFKEWEADVTNKSVGFFQGFSIFLMSPINDAIVLTTHHDFYGYPVTKEDKIWSAAGLFTFGTSKTLKALRLFDKLKKTKKIEHGVEAVGTGLDIKTGRETYKKNKRRGANEKK